MRCQGVYYALQDLKEFGDKSVSIIGGEFGVLLDNEMGHGYMIFSYFLVLFLMLYPHL